MITPEKLAELEALCENATPGPWLIDYSGTAAVYEDDAAGRTIFLAGSPHCPPRSESETNCNLRFIAAARTALPEAIAEIRRLQSELQRLQPQPQDTFAPRTEWPKEGKCAALPE
jgi:hypothetical protein